MSPKWVELVTSEEFLRKLTHEILKTLINYYSVKSKPQELSAFPSLRQCMDNNEEKFPQHQLNNRRNSEKGMINLEHYLKQVFLSW
ncbi:hypothetical protein ACTXT7_005191 [Hymenolepis weldensis]